ncbi:DUF948 domain-containing protein [Phormidesmis priestleyi]|uniref:DUF948 domain-containing protein n=1 Tax=Phormidesmis priestleyi TaxID=268141 RepID=UPI000AF6A80A|nr:DUF948 domain-containing protein [Phormidesmis priestleyi]
MIDPIFWLGLSILLVAVSIAAVLIVMVPAIQELSRAARSAHKLFDTLNRELPPTLEAIRLTGLEITELTDDISQGVQSSSQVVKQVDQSISGVKQQVQKAQTTSRSVFAGAKAAWKTLTQPAPKTRRDRLSSSTRNSIDLNESRRPEPNSEPLDRPYASPGYLAYPEVDDLGNEILELDSHSSEVARNGLRDPLRDTHDRSDQQPTRSDNNF